MLPARSTWKRRHRLSTHICKRAILKFPPTTYHSVSKPTMRGLGSSPRTSRRKHSTIVVEDMTVTQTSFSPGQIVISWSVERQQEPRGRRRPRSQNGCGAGTGVGG